MKLSIIIPYYNADKYIGRMLDSLLRQDMSLDEYEIIVVDDGSKEEPVVLKDYVQNHQNIHYIRQENAGPGAARNTGIAAAKGEYIFFCDSDDYVAENVIAGLYEAAHSRHLDVLYHKIRLVNTDKQVKFRGDWSRIEVYPSGKEIFSHLPKRPNGVVYSGPCSYLIKKEFIGRICLAFPTNWIMNEDSSFLIDAVRAAGPVGLIDVDVYFYVTNPQSICHDLGLVKQSERFCNNMLQFVQKLTDVLHEEENASNKCDVFIESIAQYRNYRAYVLLFIVCKFLPPGKAGQYVSYLRAIKAYPKPYGSHKWRKRIILNPIGFKFINWFYYMNSKRSN